MAIEEIYMPGNIIVRDEAVYILDYQPAPRVLKINIYESRIEQVYGGRHGSGPGEIAQPTDFTVTKNGDVWVADVENSRLSGFDPEGNEDTIILHQQIPYKISSSDQSNNIALTSQNSSKVSMIQKDETVYWESDNLTRQNHHTWNNILSAFSIYYQDNQAFQVGNFAGFIAKYNKEGKLDYLRETILHKQNPVGTPVRGLEQLVYNVDREALDYAVVNGSVKGDKLILHVHHYDEDVPWQTLDMYSVSDGSYLYSYKLDQIFRDVYISSKGTLAGLKSRRRNLFV